MSAFVFGPKVIEAKADHYDRLPVEFSYPEERLAQMRSPILITLERIDKWDAPLDDYFEKTHVRFRDKTRFYTYLYVAQRDAAFLSYNVHRCFVGSLDPLTAKVVKTFFPGFTEFPEMESDAYSELLADVVWAPYAKRIAEEGERWQPWVGPVPKAPAPRGDLVAQVEEMERMRAHLTSEQVGLAKAWATTDYWRQMINSFMQEGDVGLGKQLMVRGVTRMGFYDAYIAAAEAKEHYDVPRPHLVDPSIETLVKTPNSSSYPSAHSAVAGAQEVILCHYFPGCCEQWSEIARNEACSRIWAGVHTPEDVDVGYWLGQQAAQSVIASPCEGKTNSSSRSLSSVSSS